MPRRVGESNYHNGRPRHRTRKARKTRGRKAESRKAKESAPHGLEIQGRIQNEKLG